MATKLQELLKELKELPKCSCRIDCNGDADYIQTECGTLIESTLIDELITKYTETTPTYNPKNKEISYTEEEVRELFIKRAKELSTNSKPFNSLLLKQDLEWFENNKKK